MIDPPRPGWRDDRACVSTTLAPATLTGLFYPGPGGVGAARQFCERCPVRWDCLAHALLEREHHGVWGGESERSRRRLARRLKRGTITWTEVIGDAEAGESVAPAV